tara:strand:- start:2696 stop:2932 length:237 start_codon:yes stop_codon:yes gene_type:complete
MQSSCLLCISTLLESGNHYSKMFELTDSIGNKLFETISITLVRLAYRPARGHTHARLACRCATTACAPVNHCNLNTDA